jgi:prevent-host-death family protein
MIAGATIPIGAEMPKAVSTAEAETEIGSLLEYVAEQGDEVIVERHGKPEVVFISAAAYEEVDTLRDRLRRLEALERLRRLQEEVSARNQDLTEEQAIALSVEIGREALQRLVDRGEVTFERDRS